MAAITDALALKDTAPRSHIAAVYGGIGLLVGMFVLGR